MAWFTIFWIPVIMKYVRPDRVWLKFNLSGKNFKKCIKKEENIEMVKLISQSLEYKFIFQCETIVCHDGIKVMSNLAKSAANQELCIRLAQVFLIQDWVKPERTCCTQVLYYLLGKIFFIPLHTKSERGV